MNRNLDGYCFRVERNGEWQNVSFSDLTEDERNIVMDGEDAAWLRVLCCHLADQLKMAGDQFGLIGVGDE